MFTKKIEESMTEKMQEEFRGEYIRDAKKQAWRIFCQVAFLQTEFNKSLKNLSTFRARVATLEKEIKEFEAKGNRDESWKKDREEIRLRNMELQQIKPAIDIMAKNMQESSQMIQQKAIEGEQYLATAKFAETYAWVEPKAPENDGEIKPEDLEKVLKE